MIKVPPPKRWEGLHVEIGKVEPGWDQFSTYLEVGSGRDQPINNVWLRYPHPKGGKVFFVEIGEVKPGWDQPLKWLWWPVPTYIKVGSGREQPINRV